MRERLRRRDALAGEQHAHREAERHLALQQRHAAVERQAPDARLGQAEGRVLQATMMSQPSTISKPPPSAWPFTRAITGTSSVSRSAMPPKPPGAPRPSIRPLGRAAFFMSAPVAEGPLAGAGQHHHAHVAALSISLQMRCSSASVARSTALSTSGRSIVTVATWSSTS